MEHAIIHATPRVAAGPVERDMGSSRWARRRRQKKAAASSQALVVVPRVDPPTVAPVDVRDRVQELIRRDNPLLPASATPMSENNANLELACRALINQMEQQRLSAMQSARVQLHARAAATLEVANELIAKLELIANLVVDDAHHSVEPPLQLDGAQFAADGSGRKRDRDAFERDFAV